MTEQPAELATATYRKIAWRIVPFLFLLYVIAFLDRVNVSYAKLTMSDDLGFSETVYGLGAGMFFIGYFFLEIPSNLILEKVGARWWIARILVVWGIISSAFMFVQTPMQFYVMRFLLGVGEAGFFPGIILYLTYWFPGPSSRAHDGAVHDGHRDFRRDRRSAVRRDHEGLRRCARTHRLAVAVPARRPAGGRVRVRDARLSRQRPEDGEMAHRRPRRHWSRASSRRSGPRSRRSAVTRCSAHSVKDWKVWMLVLIYFSNVIAFYGVSFFMPQLIKEMGVTDLFMNGLVSAIPWAVAAVAMVLNARHSDRTLERRWHIAIPGIFAGVGLVVAAWVGSSPAVIAMIALTVTTADRSAFRPRSGRCRLRSCPERPRRQHRADQFLRRARRLLRALPGGLREGPHGQADECALHPRRLLLPRRRARRGRAQGAPKPAT